MLRRVNPFSLRPVAWVAPALASWLFTALPAAEPIERRASPPAKPKNSPMTPPSIPKAVAEFRASEAAFVSIVGRITWFPPRA